MKLFDNLKNNILKVAKPLMITAGLFAGTAFFGGNTVQAQQKNQTETTKTPVKDAKGNVIGENVVEVTRDASGKVVATRKFYRTYEKTTTEKTVTTPGKKGTGQVAGPKMTSEEWKEYLKNETPEQKRRRLEREARERGETPGNQVKETIIVIKEVEKEAVDSLKQETVKATPDTVRIPVPYEVPVVMQTPPKPKRPWIASIGGQITSPLSSGDLYKGHATPGIFAQIQSPQFGENGTVGGWVNAYARVAANFKKPLQSVIRNQGCGCVSFVNVNDASNKAPQIQAEAGLKFGPMLEVNDYVSINPHLVGGAAFETRDRLTVTEGKELTPQAKKEQKQAFFFGGVGVDAHFDFGGNPKKGLGLIVSANAIAITKGMSHTNPYSEPNPADPNPTAVSPNQPKLGLDGALRARASAGLRFTF